MATSRRTSSGEAGDSGKLTASVNFVAECRNFMGSSSGARVRETPDAAFLFAPLGLKAHMPRGFWSAEFIPLQRSNVLGASPMFLPPCCVAGRSGINSALLWLRLHRAVTLPSAVLRQRGQTITFHFAALHFGCFMKKNVKLWFDPFGTGAGPAAGQGPGSPSQNLLPGRQRPLLRRRSNRPAIPPGFAFTRAGKETGEETHAETEKLLPVCVALPTGGELPPAVNGQGKETTLYLSAASRGAAHQPSGRTILTADRHPAKSNSADPRGRRQGKPQGAPKPDRHRQTSGKTSPPIPGKLTDLRYSHGPSRPL